jgi:hypothetical protein
MAVLREILQDTLKKDGKWSRTSLTMFSAWIVSLSMAMFDFFFNGLKYDVWVTLVVVATGIKITDALSKKIAK